MKYSNLLLTSLSLALLVGCSNENPTLYGGAHQDAPLDPVVYDRPETVEGQKPVSEPIPEDTIAERPTQPPPPAPAERITQQDNEIFKPKVDILFVTDTSDSMGRHQTKLKANINLFSQNFLRKKDFLDFHVGVVGPWDAINFKGIDKNCRQGELRPLGGIPGGRGLQDCRPARNSDQLSYVTNDTDSNNDRLNRTLADTLAIGVEPYSSNPANSGPEHEQLFSPVIAALKIDSNTADGINKGFRREDAHLALVFLTDTDDFNFLTIRKDAEVMSTPATRDKLLQFQQNTDSYVLERLDISVTEMSNHLLSFKRENVSVSVYGAMARYNQLRNNNLNSLCDGSAASRGCKADFYIDQSGRGPFKMVQLIDRMNGIGFDLNEDNFGAKLSEFGNDIVDKSLRRTIILQYKPNLADPRYIVVKYGSQTIAEDKTPNDDNHNGWYYDVQGALSTGVHRIIVGEKTAFRFESNARFSVEYTPVKSAANQTGPQ